MVPNVMFNLFGLVFKSMKRYIEKIKKKTKDVGQFYKMAPNVITTFKLIFSIMPELFYETFLAC